jgi:hypothetical protein
VGGEAKLANVARQPALVVLRVADGMRPSRQLGEQENGNEQESAQRSHGAILTPIIGPGGRRVREAADAGTRLIFTLTERPQPLQYPGAYSLKIQLAITK